MTTETTTGEMTYEQMSKVLKAIRNRAEWINDIDWNDPSEYEIEEMLGFVEDIWEIAHAHYVKLTMLARG